MGGGEQEDSLLSDDESVTCRILFYKNPQESEVFPTWNNMYVIK